MLSPEHEAPTTSTVWRSMTPEHWRQVRAILEEALERPPPERHAFVEAACAGEAAIRHDVEALLELDAEAEGFLDTPLFDIHGQRDDVCPGDRLGRYRVIRTLGSGGMGRVYLAERDDRAYEQKVAIKVLKRGLDTDEIVSRFLRERQILANLQHDGIARLFDGGRTDDGLPYFVTEYVEGTPIDRYCEREELSLEQCLELFCRVCDAVEFAHQSTVVHRDLKPVNILVTAEGRPKLLDFGIAKAVADDGSDPFPTRAWMRFMTTEVASPEQILGGPVRTTSDVYTLGVLLYTLLTGRNPHTEGTVSRTDVERAVVERTPRPPSQVAPEERRSALRGDLDNIVLTALRKEPERRYGSARELADDVRRYLSNRPVHASGDGWPYRLGKLVRRHRLGTVGVAVFLLLVLVFSILALSLYRQTEREQQRAERVSVFLEDLLTSPHPGRSRGEALTVREVLDDGRESILGGLEEEPELRAELMDTMARVYRSLGLYDDARALHEQALAIRRHELGNDDPLVAESLHGLAEVLRDLGDTAATAALLNEALAIQRRHRPPDDPELVKGLNNLAILQEERGELREAERLHREVLAAKRARLDASDPEIAVSLHNLAKLLYLQTDHPAAERYYRHALTIRLRHHGRLSPEVGRTLNGLASAVEAQGRPEEAERLYRDALAVRRKIHPEGHPEVAVTLSNLAMLLQQRGALAEAEPMFREALALADRGLPADHPHRAVLMRNLASLLVARGAAEEAEALAREAHAILRARLGDGHWRTADSASVLGSALARLGELAEAETLLESSHGRLAELEGAQSPYTQQALDRLRAFRERLERRAGVDR